MRIDPGEFAVRYRFAGALVVAGLLCAGVGGAAIQPADIRIVGGGLDGAEVQGRSVIQRGAVAHGLDAWREQSRLTFVLEDVWDSTLFRMYMPLAEDAVTLDARIRLHDYGRNSAYEVTSGSQRGARFGVRDGFRWQGDADRAAGVGATFYAPTMEYLLTLPFRVQEAEHVAWVDRVERDGVTYERVFATWGDPDSPSRSVDQYLLYYRADDGRLEHMECTVRDFAPFITGAVRYHRFEEVDGVLVPTEYAMHLWDLDGPRVHVVTARDLAFD